MIPLLLIFGAVLVFAVGWILADMYFDRHD